MNTKNKFFLIISTFYILFLFVPLMSRITPINAQSASIITAGSLLLIFTNVIRGSKVFKWYIVYILILFAFVMLGQAIPIGLGDMTDKRKLLIEIGFTLPTIMIFCILTHYNNIKLYNYIAFITLAANIFSFIYCIPLIFVNDNILRMALLTDIVSDSSLFAIPTYPAMHSYVIVISGLIYKIRSSYGKWKIMFLFFTFLYLYIIFKTSITTNLIISLIVILFAFIYKNNQRNAIISTVSFSIFILILHFSGALLSMFNMAVEMTEGTYSHSKIIGFRDMYLNDEDDDVVASRHDLHMISLVSFFQSPVWGKNANTGVGTLDAGNVSLSNSVVGHHSSILDRMGGMGLIGTIPFLMVFFSIYKVWKKRFYNKDALCFYYYGLAAAGILLCEKAVFGQEGWFSLCIYLPTLLLSTNTLNTRN